MSNVLEILSSCMLVLLTNRHFVVVLLLSDHQLFAGEKKEERDKRKEIRDKRKSEKKDVAIQFVFLCLTSFPVQLNLHLIYRNIITEFSKH
jgi:hypothetical protein